MEELERHFESTTILIYIQTTLVKALKQETERGIFSTKKEIEETKTTVGIDVHEIEYLNVMSWSDFRNKINITVWDFAGQLEYSVNHQVSKILTISNHF